MKIAKIENYAIIVAERTLFVKQIEKNTGQPAI
jgi:hypothetical protein